MGIIPLYIGWDENGTFYVASELKALEVFVLKLSYFLQAIIYLVNQVSLLNGTKENGERMMP